MTGLCMTGAAYRRCRGKLTPGWLHVSDSYAPHRALGSNY